MYALNFFKLCLLASTYQAGHPLRLEKSLTVFLSGTQGAVVLLPALKTFFLSRENAA